VPIGTVGNSRLPVLATSCPPDGNFLHGVARNLASVELEQEYEIAKEREVKVM